jgi:isopentenyldiphosphate isomerase
VTGATDAVGEAVGDADAGHRARAALELVDVLDDEGKVIGTAERHEVRANNWWHRSVFVTVVTSDDEVIVHQRAPWKDVWPSRWDFCFGGVVDAGEDWRDAAVRELGEEAGVIITTDDLEDLGEDRYEDALVREVSRLYLVRSDGPFSFDDGEVAASDRVPRQDLLAWATARELVSDSREMMLHRLVPGGAP